MSTPRPAVGRGGRLELVAATLLVLLLLAGAWTLFQQNQQRTAGAAPVSRGEDALRAAFDAVEPELRMAGAYGLTARPEFIAGSAGAGDPPGAIDAAVTNDCGPNFVADLARPIEARHGYGLACRGTRPAAWSDVIVVRRAATRASAPGSGAVELIATRLGGALHLAGRPTDEFLANARADRHELEVSAFYVGADAPSAHEWTLRRQRLTHGADGRPAMVDEALVRGIVDLKVTLGVDTDGDGSVDLYVPPGAPELASGRIVSVRLTLAAFADEPKPAAPAAESSREGPLPDRWRRLVLERTIAVRSAGSD